jgi:hypothetical protein
MFGVNVKIKNLKYSPLSSDQCALGDDQTSASLRSLSIVLNQIVVGYRVLRPVSRQGGHRDSVGKNDVPKLERFEKSLKILRHCE